MRKLYWLGNSAKVAVVDEILQMEGPVQIVDLGCGDGGDWPSILADHPRLSLTGFDPHEPSAQSARDRLRNLNARIISADELSDVSADVIVSFSVYEHVIDRAQFLRQAKRILNPNGLFYLNYDDGHFRYELDLGEVGTWKQAAKSALLTRLAGPLARLGRPQHFQRRVPSGQADREVENAGFLVKDVHYCNLRDMKLLAKTIPADRSQAFHQAWLQLERQLNDEFALKGAIHAGDEVNLWRVMASRTMKLTHKA